METAYTTDCIYTEEGYELVFTKDEETFTEDKIQSILLRLLVVLSLSSSLGMPFSDGLEYERFLRIKTMEIYRNEFGGDNHENE